MNILKIIISISIMLSCITCSTLFPTTPKINENIVTATPSDSLNRYFIEIDSLYFYAKNQSLMTPDSFDLNTSGWYYMLAPDSSKIAFIYDGKDWKMGYHEIRIWDISEKKSISICAFREGDPGSGVSNFMYWSTDSKKLFFVGIIIDEISYSCLIYSYPDKVLYDVSDEYLKYKNETAKY